jgi:hypothetical protein
MEKTIASEVGAATETCFIGSATDSPCPYPATEPVPGSRDRSARMCAYHVAIEPLLDEQNDLGIALGLLPRYLKAARRHHNAPLIFALEQLQADFERRFELLDGVADALRDAEMRLFRR